MEEPAGLEPANSSFAGCGLTNLAMVPHGKYCCMLWSGRTGSNRRPQPWQGYALPLSYSRKHLMQTTMDIFT